MPRITNAVASRKRRKRRLEQAKGFYGSRSKLFRIATEAVDGGPHFQHRLLQHVVGLAAVAAEAQRQGEHRPFEPAI